MRLVSPITDSGGLTVQALTSSGGLEALRSEWRELFLRDPAATPFQSPAWLLSWWRYLGEGELLSLAVRERSQRLVALVPLYLRVGVSGSRELLPVGVATSDYLDGLFERDSAVAAVRAAFAYLDGIRERWDKLELQSLRAESPLLTAPAPQAWSEEITSSTPCPVLTLPDSPSALSAQVPARMAHNLDFYRRRAAKLGVVRYTRADADNLDELWQAHVRLHSTRWQARGETGVLTDTRVLQAHEASLPELLSDGTLRLYALCLDRRIIATLHGFLGKPGPERRFYHYLAGFDPAFDKISPGTLIIAHAMEQAILDGARVFDFLAGQEAYKYRWGAVDTKLQRRLLRPRTSRSSHAASAITPPAEPLARFSVQLAGVIRPCERADLPSLEWFGLFGPELIAETFAQHERGEMIMLVAEVNSVASGQAWIQLDPAARVGFLWALRVFPALQGQGIGTRLIAACERVLRDRGYQVATISVEPSNHAALRLYQRLGYELIADVPSGVVPTDPCEPSNEAASHLMLQKQLAEPSSAI